MCPVFFFSLLCMCGRDLGGCVISQKQVLGMQTKPRKPRKQMHALEKVSEKKLKGTRSQLQANIYLCACAIYLI